MNIFYLKWSFNPPKHPKEIYKNSWETGISYYGRICPKTESLVDWQKKIIDRYEKLLKEYQDNGRLAQLNSIINPSKEDRMLIEKDPNFIEWVDLELSYTIYSEKQP